MGERIRELTDIYVNVRFNSGSGENHFSVDKDNDLFILLNIILN